MPMLDLLCPSYSSNITLTVCFPSFSGNQSALMGSVDRLRAMEKSDDGPAFPVPWGNKGLDRHNSLSIWKIPYSIQESIQINQSLRVEE